MIASKFKCGTEILGSSECMEVTVVGAMTWN